MAQSASPSTITAFIRWLRLKNYQYEVTFALYMLTPTEKCIFNLLLLLVISMFVTAAYIYLPNHIMTICNRIWYYVGGDSFSANIPMTASPGMSVVDNDTISMAGREGYDMVMQTVKKAAETATTAAAAAAGRGGEL